MTPAGPVGLGRGVGGQAHAELLYMHSDLREEVVVSVSYSDVEADRSPSAGARAARGTGVGVLGVSESLSSSSDELDWNSDSGWSGDFSPGRSLGTADWMDSLAFVTRPVEDVG